MGNPSTALSHLKQALQIYEKSFPPNHLDLVSSHNNIALMYQSSGGYSAAFQHCEKALKIQQQSLPSNHPDLVTSHTYIAAAYSGLLDYAKL